MAVSVLRMYPFLNTLARMNLLSSGLLLNNNGFERNEFYGIILELKERGMYSLFYRRITKGRHDIMSHGSSGLLNDAHGKILMLVSALSKSRLQTIQLVFVEQRVPRLHSFQWRSSLHSSYSLSTGEGIPVEGTLFS